MDKGLVSVVVPVYNVKAYLEKCINSILNQTYENLEIIIVDDGSTDGSSDICDQFLKKDNRVFVIHKENGGVVSARQAGIDKAKGEYVIAIDSDDWIEPIMISELYTLAIENDADIVSSGYYRESGDTYGIVIDGIKEGVYSDDNKEFLYHNMFWYGNSDKIGIIGSISTKLIKLSLLKKIHSKISNRICYSEDLAAIYGCCVHAEIIVVTHMVYYHYIMRAGSAIFSIIPYYFRDINDIYLFLKKEFEDSIYREILIKQLDLLMVKWAFWGLNYYLGLNKEMSIPYYDFDRTIIEKDAKIILYSAGKVGQSYYKQICIDKLYNVVAWVDKKYLFYQEQGLNVSAIEVIKDSEYDYILLAFKEESLAESVKESLKAEYDIAEKKFIWFKPITIIDKYFLNED